MREALDAVEAEAQRAEWVAGQRAYMEQVRTACGCPQHVGGLFLEQVARIAYYQYPDLGESEEQAEAFLATALEGGAALAAND